MKKRLSMHTIQPASQAVRSPAGLGSGEDTASPDLTAEWAGGQQGRVGNQAILERIRESENPSPPLEPGHDGKGGDGSTPVGYGEPIAESQGVTAYSNGPSSSDFGVYGEYGDEYQCVEYVNRFAVEALGLGNMKGTGNAQDYASQRSGLTWVPNVSGPSLPSGGDILVFGGGSYGHVAICSSSSGSSVSFIQQNTSSPWASVSVEGEEGAWQVANWGSYALLGWQSTGQEDIPECSSPAEDGDAPAGTAYTVVAGDTLWDISVRFLGDGSRYLEIYEDNRATIGPDPSRIQPGMALTIGANNMCVASDEDLVQPDTGASPLDPTTQEKVAAWAQQAWVQQDSRFFDSETDNLWDWLGSLRDGSVGYSKCNQFVAAAFREGGGVDYPLMDGRDPLVEELVNPANFADQLSFSSDPEVAAPGDMVLWYDADKLIHHSAVITGYNENGELLVTYAGCGEKIQQITISEATRRLKDVAPVFRSWIGKAAQAQNAPNTMGTPR